MPRLPAWLSTALRYLIRIFQISIILFEFYLEFFDPDVFDLDFFGTEPRIEASTSSARAAVGFCSMNVTTGRIPGFITLTPQQQLLDIDDALVSETNPASSNEEELMDYERCARLHNHLVALGWMAYHDREEKDLAELQRRSSFFERDRDRAQIPLDRLDPSLISFLERIILPDDGFFYWVWDVAVTPGDESFFLEDNDLDNKERFVVLYGTHLDLGGHCVGLVYDQQRHLATMTLTLWNIGSVSPIEEHLDMWHPLETILTNWILMSRIGKATASPELDWGTEVAQLGPWIWHSYSAAQVDTAVAAMDRLSSAIEARMPAGSLLPVDRDTSLLTNAELDAASVPQDCFIRSFLTRIKTPRFRRIAPGLEVPHDPAAFASRQQFSVLPAYQQQQQQEEEEEEEGRMKESDATMIPPILIFPAADSSRTVGFNQEIRRCLVTGNDLEENVPFTDHQPIHTGLYSEMVLRGESDIAEEGFRLLLPFPVRPGYQDDGAPRRSDGSFITTGSLTELFQHGCYHPFGGEWRAQRLERLLDRWWELIESGVWIVGADGVEGSIDRFMDAGNGAWQDYWIEPSW